MRNQILIKPNFSQLHLTRCSYCNEPTQTDMRQSDFVENDRNGRERKVRKPE